MYIVSIYSQIYRYIHIYIYAHTHTHTHTHIHTYTYIYIYIYDNFNRIFINLLEEYKSYQTYLIRREAS